jgi:hypothetical protein
MGKWTFNVLWCANDFLHIPHTKQHLGLRFLALVSSKTAFLSISQGWCMSLTHSSGTTELFCGSDTCTGSCLDATSVPSATQTLWKKWRTVVHFHIDLCINESINVGQCEAKINRMLKIWWCTPCAHRCKNYVHVHAHMHAQSPLVKHAIPLIMEGSRQHTHTHQIYAIKQSCSYTVHLRNTHHGYNISDNLWKTSGINNDV